MTPMQHIRKAVFRISQSEMASISNTSQATVSRWEKGELSPDLSQMARIRDEAQSRGIEWSDGFFFDAPDPAPEGAPA
jgi:transcriptional regulator with XRE-family HTH domain